jgi:hypothetical protein
LTIQVVSGKDKTVPLNHLVKKDQAKFVEYLVPATIPMPAHKKICIELMDEIINNAFGVHFLEPIAIERQVTKIVPKITSIRTSNFVV